MPHPSPGATALDGVIRIVTSGLQLLSLDCGMPLPLGARSNGALSALSAGTLTPVTIDPSSKWRDEFHRRLPGNLSRLCVSSKIGTGGAEPYIAD